MSFVEPILLALALCVDTLVVSAATAMRSQISSRQGVLMAFILGFCQLAFPLVGAIIGDVSRAFIEVVDHWIAFGLLAFIGGKMIMDGMRGEADEEEMPHKRLSLWTFFALGVATSIDGLAVGIGLGLNNPMAEVLRIVSIIGIVTFVISMLGIYLGKRHIPIPERVASIVAGVVLIALGVKILVEHLV